MLRLVNIRRLLYDKQEVAWRGTIWEPSAGICVIKHRAALNLLNCRNRVDLHLFEHKHLLYSSLTVPRTMLDMAMSRLMAIVLCVPTTFVCDSTR